MIREDDLSTLEASNGTEASRLFLEQMILHHGGAVEMAQTHVDDASNTDAVELAQTISMRKRPRSRRWKTSWPISSESPGWVPEALDSAPTGPDRPSHDSKEQRYAPPPFITRPQRPCSRLRCHSGSRSCWMCGHAVRPRTVIGQQPDERARVPGRSRPIRAGCQAGHRTTGHDARR